MHDFEIIRHLAERGCEYQKYRLSIGEGVAVFPLWTFGGKMKGYQQYRPHAPKHCQNPKDARYFTRGFEPCLWGLEYLPQDGEVFVAESVFKAIALHNAGFSAVAALGSDVCEQLRQQMALSPYQWIFAGDLDPAGLKFSKTFGRGFVSPDLDELSTEEVFALASRAVNHG